MEETVPLRHSVLWPDKPASYVRLLEDDLGFHYGAYISSSSATPIAVISIFVEPLPSSESPDALGHAAARFRKFACEPSHQGQGIGTALLRHVFHVSQSELGCSAVWCDARVSSARWYERRGLVGFGDVFLKGGIEYIKMKIEF